MWTAHAIAINEELFLREGHARAFILRDAWMGCKIASWIYKLVDINAWQGPDAVNNVDTNELDNWGGSSFHYSVYMYTPRRNSSSNLFLEPGITSNVDYVLRKTCLWIVCIENELNASLVWDISLLEIPLKWNLMGSLKSSTQISTEYIILTLVSIILIQYPWWLILLINLIYFINIFVH